MQKRAENAMTPNQRAGYQNATSSHAAGTRADSGSSWLKTEFNNLGNNMAQGWNAWKQSPTGSWMSKTFQESPALTSAALGLGLAGTGYAVQRVLRAGQQYPQQRSFQQYPQPQMQQSEPSIMPWLGLAGLVGGGAYIWNQYGDKIKTMFNQAKTLSAISPDLKVLGDLSTKANGNKLKLLWEYWKLPAEQKQQIANALEGMKQLNPDAAAAPQQTQRPAPPTVFGQPVVPPPERKPNTTPEQRKQELSAWYWQQQMGR